MLAASRSSWATPGWGASPSSSPSWRRNPSRRCSSATACRLDVLDRGQRVLRLGLIAVDHDARGAGLDPHHAHVVGDDVVQLARDPHALGEHGAPRVLLALALGLQGALLGGRGLRRALAQGEAGEPRDREQAGREEELPGVLGRVVVGDDRGGGEGHRQPDPPLGRVLDIPQQEGGRHARPRRAHRATSRRRRRRTRGPRPPPIPPPVRRRGSGAARAGGARRRAPPGRRPTPPSPAPGRRPGAARPPARSRSPRSRSGGRSRGGARTSGSGPRAERTPGPGRAARDPGGAAP